MFIGFSFIIIRFIIKRNKNNLPHNVINKLKTTSKSKKKYNIDKELEKNILKGISDLRKSQDFLDSNFSSQHFCQKFKYEHLLLILHN